MAKAEVFKDVRYPDRLNRRESKVVETAKSGCLNFAKRTISYSDLIDGQAVEFGDAIPKGAVVQRIYLNVLEAFSIDGDPDTGDGITLAIGLTSASDIQSAASVLGAPYSSTGRKATGVDGAIANYVDLSSDVKVNATAVITNNITSEDDVPGSDPVEKGIDEVLDAGSLEVIVEYVIL